MEYALKESQGLFYFPGLSLQCQKQNYYGSTKMLEELFKTNIINQKNVINIKECGSTMDEDLKCKVKVKGSSHRFCNL